MTDIKVFESKNVPQKYQDQINQLLAELYQSGESKIKNSNFETTDKFIIGITDGHAVGFVRLSGNNDFSSIAYVARSISNGKGVTRALIKYIQTNLDVKRLSAGISSNVPEKVERLLLDCGFIKGKTFYTWSKET